MLERRRNRSTPCADWKIRIDALRIDEQRRLPNGDGTEANGSAASPATINISDASRDLHAPGWIRRCWVKLPILIRIRCVRSCRVRVMTQARNVAVDATLDATGLLCPLPVLKARRALKPLAAGAILEILATDPGATRDFEHFCQTTGCELLEAREEPGGVLRFWLKKPG
jgi:tRNA 2-thiouridine synthesizing protein A